MDEELKKLLTLSTKSVTGLTDSLKKESVGESNIKAAVEDQTSSETGLLEDIKNTLQNTFKQQVKTDKEKEFESKKAKKPSPAAVKKVTQPIVNFVSPIAKTLGTILKSLAAAILALIAIMNIDKLKKVGKGIKDVAEDVIDFVKDNALSIGAGIIATKALVKKIFVKPPKARIPKGAQLVDDVVPPKGTPKGAQLVDDVVPPKGTPKGRPGVGRVAGAADDAGDFRRVLRTGFKQVDTPRGARFRNPLGQFAKLEDATDTIPVKRVNFFVKNFGKGSKFATFFDDFFRIFWNIMDTIGSKRANSIIKLVAKIGFKSLKVVLGKLLWPLEILLAVINFGIGFFTRLKEDDEATIRDAMGSGLGNLMAELIGVPLDLLKMGIQWIFKKIGWTGAATKMENFSFADTIKSAFETEIGMLYTDLVLFPITTLRLAIEGVIGLIKNWKKTKDEGGTTWDAIFAGIDGLMAPILESLILIWNPVEPLGIINKLAKFLFDFIPLFADWTIEGIGAAIKFIWNTGEPLGIINKIGKFFGDLPGLFADWVVDAIPTAMQWLWNTEEGENRGFINKVGDFFKGLPAMFKDFIVEGIPAAMKWLWNTETGENRGFINKVGDFFRDLPGKFIDFVPKLASKTIEGVKSVIEAIVNFFKKIADFRVGEWIGGLFRRGKFGEAIQEGEGGTARVGKILADQKMGLWGKLAEFFVAGMGEELENQAQKTALDGTGTPANQLQTNQVNNAGDTYNVEARRPYNDGEYAYP